MVELIVRLCVSLGFLGLGLIGVVPFDVSWKAAAALAGLSLFGWRLEDKGLVNAGVAGFFAIGEAFTLAVLLAGAGSLHDLGFLVLVPCLVAGLRHSSPMVSMAPLAASALVAADCLFSRGGMPAPQTFVQAAGVLGLSLLLGMRRPQQGQGPILGDDETRPTPQLFEDGMLQLRENYRRLRDAYSDLERRSRRDKIVARIAKAQTETGPKFYSEICTALRELTRAEELAIYTLAQFEQVMVVRSVSEEFPGALKDHSIDIDVAQAPIIVRERAEAALGALTMGAAVANVLLVHKGKMVGMVCALDTHRLRLEEIRKGLNEAAPEVAKAIEAEMQREATTRRLTELELLYEISSITSGASTPAMLAGRVTREVRQTLGLDSIRIAFIDKNKEKIIANEGSKVKLLDCMSFDGNKGIAGWTSAGAPELVLFDVRQDKRCDPEESLKRRIGSFLLIPLWIGAEVAGYLSAATQHVGGIDQDKIGTLRLVGAELSRALERLKGEKYGGMMTPVEFASSTAGRKGTLVFLEPLRREHTIAAYGYAAFEEAVRKLAHQVRAKLPTGSCLCRRTQGDFLVFLDTDEEFAGKWANEATASASLIAISTSDPTKRVPLALRAKVAQLTSQTHQLSVEIPA